MPYKRNSKYNYKPVEGVSSPSLFRRSSRSAKRITHYDYSPQNGLTIELEPAKHKHHRRIFVVLSVACIWAGLWLFLSQSNASYFFFDNKNKAAQQASSEQMLASLDSELDKQKISIDDSDVQSLLNVHTDLAALLDMTGDFSELGSDELADTTTEADLEEQADEPQWLTLTVQSGDNMSLLFQRHNLSRSDLHRILRLGGDVKKLASLQPGQEVRVLTDENNGIQSLRLELGLAQELQVDRKDDDSGFFVNLFEQELDTKITTVAGTLNSSLRVDGRRAGMSRAVLSQFIKLFGWEVDFTLDVKKGDTFKVVFEDYYFQGERAKTGAILAAEYVNDGRVYQVVRYLDSDGEAHYYTPEGKSLQRTFLSKPVKSGILTSGFNLKRRHPILGTVRPHKGVDYSASTGTDIYAAAAGKVSFVGRKGGYGRTVIIQHGDKHQTLYAHLSRFSSTLKQGQRVRQGQLIGYVGHSGLATGSHLHFEVHVDGVAKNPLKVKLPRTEALEKRLMADFHKQTQPLLAMLTPGNEHADETVRVASAADSTESASTSTR